MATFISTIKFTEQGIKNIQDTCKRANAVKAAAKKMGVKVVETWGAFQSYSWACGALLARAHARTADIAKIAGYCGISKGLDRALVDFVEAYGDQTERDHAALVAAIKLGRVEEVRKTEPGSAEK